MFPIRKIKANTPARSGAFARAVERMRAASRPGTRIGFIIDATGSREAGWEQAQTAQGRMFDAVAGFGKVSLRLVHYGGGGLTDHGYSEDAIGLAAAMAAVRCRRGLTQILPALEALRIDDVRPEAIIIVGDAFEEDADALARALPFIRQAGIRIFSFFEGENRAAEFVFRRMAEETGGRFARLGDGLPLGDLCAGVALLAAGGSKAVKRLKNERARRLLLGGPSD